MYYKKHFFITTLEAGIGQNFKEMLRTHWMQFGLIKCVLGEKINSLLKLL